MVTPDIIYGIFSKVGENNCIQLYSYLAFFYLVLVHYINQCFKCTGLKCESSLRSVRPIIEVSCFLVPTIRPASCRRGSKAAGVFFACPFSPQLVELKNGETYNGHLVSCDNWMNINLREVICTSRVKRRSRVTCSLTKTVHTASVLFYMEVSVFCFRDYE